MEKGRHQNIEKEFNPEELERAQYLAEQFEKGLNDKNIFAYHGTSTETLQDIIKNGYIRGGHGAYPPGTTGPRQISVFPIDNEVGPFVPGKAYHNDPQLQATMGYAKDIARNHSVLNSLGIDLNDDDFRIIADEDDNARELLVKRGIVTQAQLDKATADMEAKKPGGIVLGLDRRILKDFQIRTEKHPADEEGEMVIVCPNGIDYHYIIGLEPVGQYEYDYLENLQNKFA